MEKNPYHLLIIDDDEIDIRSIHEHLKRAHFSYNFKEARNLNAALQCLDSEEFDCVLMDCRLPDGESLERLHEFVALAHKDTAFILLTGMDDEESIQRALKSGVQDSLKKEELSKELLCHSIKAAIKIKKLEQEIAHLKKLERHSQRSLRILCVDDDPVNLKILQRTLDPFGEVTGLQDGAQAVERFKESLSRHNPFDLICLDIMMPHKSGIEALLEIRKLEQTVDNSKNQLIKIILVTSLEESLDNLSIPKELFYDGYIQKPITKEKVSGEMERLKLLNPINMAPGELL